ncbi:VOC family protein [Treponema zuelzerae]|uniref:VOC family protein n=1 Tax=Teretinema zuelzerae TaxID=156 RepID=A0AAE3EHG2_9SPIR|nr:VOC family protein [Teretinema zuelzerae]MCD1653753.1 VOC family protein [Teretinema zuelzerae]
MTLGATLYVSNSAEAAAFYCDAFGMKIGYSVKNDDGSYLHAELEKNGTGGFAVSESGDADAREAMFSAKTPTMSLGVNLDNDEELRHAFAVLSESGHVIRPLGSLPWSPSSADLVDKYGVCWYIYVSQHKPDEPR